MAPVTFWAAPRQYINWAARHKPAILWSLVLGSCGPLIVVCYLARKVGYYGQELRDSFPQATVPPLRERLGDPNRQAIPLTYPGKRKTPSTTIADGTKEDGGFS